MTVDWRRTPADDAALVLTLDDEGRPADDDALNHDLAASTKPHGLGLGLTLARSSIARLGGQLRLTRGPHNGARTLAGRAGKRRTSIR